MYSHRIARQTLSKGGAGLLDAPLIRNYTVNECHREEASLDFLYTVVHGVGRFSLTFYIGLILFILMTVQILLGRIKKKRPLAIHRKLGYVVYGIVVLHAFTGVVKFFV
jgi:hypothetical protein